LTGRSDGRAAPLTIDRIEIDGRVLLAPLCGITDSTFRRICRAHGASVVYSEMTSAEGLRRGSAQTREMIEFRAEERPYGVQLAASTPQAAEDGARIAGELGPDLIDLNLGCPARKVVRKGEGSALLNDLPRMERVAGALVRAARAAGVVPTAKIRIGVNKESVNGLETARRLEGCGMAAVTVHARTTKQRFGGSAHWEMIGEIKRALSVPVFGNGDVWKPEDAKRMLDETGCDAVMIGRAARGNPWIFDRTRTYLETGELPEPPPVTTRVEAYRTHVRWHVERRGEVAGVREMRKHVAGYTRGFPMASELRRRILALETVAEIDAALDDYREAYDAWKRRSSDGAAVSGDLLPSR
jgi:tRNA-dihydrouridine synthase B